MNHIDYNKIAGLYDYFVTSTVDFDFFTSEIREKGEKVLELASGTGRLSLQLIKAGADLTCVDLSRGMLDSLSEKLRKNQFSANLICSDICEMTFQSEFALALFPFQSFMELIGKEKQETALKAIYDALENHGRFICTLHNPVIRRKQVDGILRITGHFPKETGTLVVSGFEQGGNPVVRRNQFFEYYNESGELKWKRILPMQFELIEKENFQNMSGKVGFEVIELYGNYDHSQYDPEKSPVMIWVLEK